MVKYILKRLALMIVTLFVIVTATFFLMNSMPGNPVRAQAKRLPEQVAQNMEHKYGLDKPLTSRYVMYVGNLLKGDLGDSFSTPGRTTWDVVHDNMSPSAIIGLQSVAVGLVIGLLLGIIAAFNRETPVDYLVIFLAILGISVPGFVLGTLLQAFVGGKFGLPIAGWYSSSDPASSHFAFTVLPTIALCFAGIATYARYMRASVLDVISQDYILTAKAKGLSSRAIALKHILRNAILPIVTILGPQIAVIITGTVVIERIFSIPGIGNALVDAIFAKDYNIIMGLTLFFSALYILSVLIVDILYCVIDPRIKLEGSK
ncbi:MAG: ABC transporter permease [Bacillota bacterium]|nr:ABC transporter permease [Bacillota bacterium]